MHTNTSYYCVHTDTPLCMRSHNHQACVYYSSICPAVDADTHKSHALQETQQLVQDLQGQLSTADMSIAHLTFEVSGICTLMSALRARLGFEMAFGVITIITT